MPYVQDVSGDGRRETTRSKKMSAADYDKFTAEMAAVVYKAACERHQIERTEESEARMADALAKLNSAEHEALLSAEAELREMRDAGI